MNNREDLKSKWLELVSRFTGNDILIKDSFNKIEKFYSKSGRYYHNLDHIQYMLFEAEKFKTIVNDYDSILFAIWFHDIIYDTKKSDNEEKSSEFAEDFLKEINYYKTKIKKIRNLILKSKNHSNIGLNEDFDTKLFLDLDLLILGASNKEYQTFAESIRKEYYFVPDEIFNLERTKVLEKLLTQEFIFKTEEFRKRFENIARKNIKSEIKSLSKV